jgi:hypothetical protein
MGCRMGDLSYCRVEVSASVTNFRRTKILGRTVEEELGIFLYELVELIQVLCDWGLPIRGRWRQGASCGIRFALM